jgi:hypothetical protein
MTVPEVVAVPVVRDAAWAVGHAVDELREAYFVVAAATDRAGTVTAGSRHPLPARADRCWVEALALADQAERALSAGIGELRRVPGVWPLGTTGDVAAVVTTAHASVDGVARQVGQLRKQIEQARLHLLDAAQGEPAVTAAAAQWELAVVRLDRLMVRLNHGAAALSAYAVGLSVVDPGPERALRLAGLLPRTRPPAGEILAGAVAAGRLVFEIYPDRYPLPVPAARKTSWAHRLLSAALRPDWLPAIRRAVRRTDRAERGAPTLATCARAVRLLARADLIGYQRCLNLLDRQAAVDTYAGFLAAAFLLAVERRFRPGRDESSVTRFVAGVRDHYALPAADVDALGMALIRAALGEQQPPITRSSQVITVESVLLLGLLADEDLTWVELDEFLAETGRLYDKYRADP